jgi:hypothetical protein
LSFAAFQNITTGLVERKFPWIGRTASIEWTFSGKLNMAFWAHDDRKSDRFTLKKVQNSLIEWIIERASASQGRLIQNISRTESCRLAWVTFGSKKWQMAVGWSIAWRIALKESVDV